MSTGTATPAAPVLPPSPRPTQPKWAGVALGLLLLAVAVLGVLEFHRHLPPPKPAPVPVPAPPAPKPEPKPVAPDQTPVAVVSGLFTPTGVPAIQAAPGDPPPPLGMFMLDASKSASTKAIKWKVHGPPLDLVAMTRDGGPGSSIVLAYPTQPGTYRFHAIARGVTRGEADADAATWTHTVADPSPPPAPPGPTPNPTPTPPAPPTPIDPNADPAFVAIGQSYRGTLGSDYADAFEAGAKMLEAGQPFSAALHQIAREWGASRVASYDKALTPAFGKIVPESTADDAVTPAQRAAMAKAWHGFAAGLRAK